MLIRVCFNKSQDHLAFSLQHFRIPVLPWSVLLQYCSWESEELVSALLWTAAMICVETGQQGDPRGQG